MADRTVLQRDLWLLASDAQLLAQCEEHRHRASGPGGQHRNKTESAIRLHHKPSGISVTASERRSQHENRSKAISRLREAIALEVRLPLDPQDMQLPETLAGVTAAGKVLIGRRDGRRLLLVAWILDALLALEGRAGDAAQLFDLTTSQLVSLLREESKRLSAANAIRSAAGLPALR